MWSQLIRFTADGIEPVRQASVFNGVIDRGLASPERNCCLEWNVLG